MTSGSEELRSAFKRQVERLRRVASDLRHRDPEGAAACLFAASVLSHLPQETGVASESTDWAQPSMMSETNGPTEQ